MSFINLKDKVVQVKIVYYGPGRCGNLSTREDFCIEKAEIFDTAHDSFYIGGGIFLLAVLWTIFKTKEYSPEELQSFEDQKVVASEDRATESRKKINYFKHGLIWAISGALFTYMVFFYQLQKELYIIGVGALIFSMIQVIVGIMVGSGNTRNGFVEVIEDLFHMPKTMSQLAIVQFFTWFALFSMWIYTTAAVTSYIYGTSDTSSQLYNNGADWVGILFSVYNGAAALIAFFLPVLAKLTNRKITHLIALSIGGLGLISFYFISEPTLLVIPMVGIGFAWASILSMPYAILTGSLPSRKMGVYMGIFNFFIVIPQILAASILGFLVKNVFAGETIFALVLGGISMIVAGFLTLIVDDKKA